MGKADKADKNEMRKDIQNDIIGAKYLQVEKSVYFMDHEIFSLEDPVKEHGKPEIVEVKNNEIEKQNVKGLIELLDLGAPVNRAGNEWMKKYLKDHGSELKDLKSSKCHQRFRVWKNQSRRVRRTNVKEE